MSKSRHDLGVPAKKRSCFWFEIRLDERLKLKDERIAELEAQLKAPKEANKRPRTEEPVALNLFGKESLREREIEKRRKYI